MKRKHVIATFALSMLLGVGVFAGIHQSKVREAKAEQQSWYVVGSFSGASKWSHTTGYAMTETSTKVWKKENLAFAKGDEFKVCDEEDKNWQGGWAYNNGDSPDKTFFTAANDGANIVCQVAGNYDITFTHNDWHIKVEAHTAPTPTYDVDLYVNNEKVDTVQVSDGNIPNSPAVYGQTFSGWYDDAAMTKGHEVTEIHSDTAIYCTVTTLEEVEYNLDLTPATDYVNEAYLYAFDDAGHNADWPGAKITNNKFKVPTDAKIIIVDVKAGASQRQTVDIIQSGVADDTLIIYNATEDGKHTSAWASNLPAEEGYYLVGSKNKWNLHTATKMGAGDEQNYAILENYAAIEGEKIKVIGYFDYTVTWYGTGDEGQDDYVFDGDKNVNIYLSKADNKIYVANYVPPVVDHDYALKVNGGTPIALTKSGEEYYVEGITVAAGDTFTFTKDEAAYAVTAEDAGNNNYGKNGVRQAGTVNLYLKPASDHFWVSGLPAPEEGQATYYMLINDKNPVKMTDNTAATANEFYLTHVELAADDEVSFMYISEAQESPVYAHYNITTVEGIEDFYKEGNVVKTAGIYDLYADMTPDHNKLYVAINHDGWVRYLDINGTKQAMTVNPDNDKEYKLTANLVAGDELAYYYGADAESATEQTSSAKAIYNNNLGADKKVLVDAQGADIYVNIETGEIWVGGIATAGYHIIKNGHTLVAMTHGDEYDGYDQWFSASIEFAKDDEITFINATEARGNQLPEIFGIGTVEESDEGAKFEVVDGTPKVIKAKEAVTTKVYLKLKYGMDRVYFGAEEQYIRAAKAFAKDFKDNLATACKASGQQKAVEDAWKDAVDAYALLAKEAKDELKLGALSSVEEVREFGARYTWFLEHKSTWNLDNFLGWEIQASNDVMGLTADDTTMTVVVISAIAVISAAGLFFLIRRKRRLVK